MIYFAYHAISERNPIHQLDWRMVLEGRVDTPAVRKRAGTMLSRHSIKGPSQTAFLIGGLEVVDNTTLSADDSRTKVDRVCAKARNPVPSDILETLGFGDLNVHTGAVCVYHRQIPYALRALEGSGIPIAAVSTSFPDGQIPLVFRLAEIRAAVAEGATEIDVVINRELALRNDWAGLWDEISQMREACGQAHMKVILGVGQLGTLERVYRASMVAMLAGADFIKTSTGKEPINATLPVSLVMARAIRDFHEYTKYLIGFKPAGGVSTAADLYKYMILMRDELAIPVDDRYLKPVLWRVGASSLVDDIVRQLRKNARDHRYASKRNIPAG